MTTISDHGNVIDSHLDDDNRFYHTIEAWSDDLYLSLEFDEAVQTAQKLLRLYLELKEGIQKLERIRNEQKRIT